MNAPKAAVSHRKHLIAELRADPELAHRYLAAAFEVGRTKTLVTALRAVVEARGTARVARAAGLSRAGLLRALSPKGDPHFNTLLVVIRAAGFGVAVVARRTGRVKRKIRHGGKRPTVEELRARLSGRAQVRPSLPPAKAVRAERGGR